jgi:hypothetical protein
MGSSSCFIGNLQCLRKKERSDYEKSVHGGQNEQDIKNFYKKTYSIMRKTASLHGDNAFHDISTIFADVRDSVYVDWFHLSERGNDRIAQTMAQDILPLIESPSRLRKNSSEDGKTTQDEIFELKMDRLWGQDQY